MKRYAKSVSRASRNLSRKKEDSNNRTKAKFKLARLHKIIKNTRNDYHWKLANRIVGEYADIYIKDVDLISLRYKSGKRVTDLGYADFVNILEYKASCVGSRVIKIDKKYPARNICSSCGYTNENVKFNGAKYWSCPSCNSKLNRYRNAAINILRYGENQLNVN